MQRIRKWLVLTLSLLAVQTATYFLLGPSQLKGRLLAPYFGSLGHHSDSVFVRDFYTTECSVGDGDRTFITHQLKSDEALLKQTFGVTYVYVQPQEQFSWDDHSEDQYQLVYQTWASQPTTWWTLFNFFQATQTETLRVDTRYGYKREVTYHWCLGFWIRTFEWFES